MTCTRLFALLLVMALAESVQAQSPVGIEHTEIERGASGAARDQQPIVQQNNVSYAGLWGLSAEEWDRYLFLKQGIRGSMAPNSSPIEMLGISARTPEERDRYAEMWAQMLHDDTANVLAFERAYQAAWNRLRLGRQLFADLSEPGAFSPVSVFQHQDRLLFFADADCQRCAKPLSRALELVEAEQLSGLDIYLLGQIDPLGQADDQAVIEWARNHKVDPGLVRGKKVTLNHDGGTLARLAPGIDSTPYLIRRRGASLAAIEPEMLR